MPGGRKERMGDSDRCPNEAKYRFTWPGRDESYICEVHLPKLRAVAGAIGLPLQVIPLTLDVRMRCTQRGVTVPEPADADS